MNHILQKAALIAAGAILIGASAAAGYWWAKQPVPAATAGADNSRKVLYWYDPMVPNQHFDKPGKSPFMDMELQPKYADEGGGEPAGVRIDPVVQQNLGIRLAPVERKPFNPEK